MRRIILCVCLLGALLGSRLWAQEVKLKVLVEQPKNQLQEESYVSISKVGKTIGAGETIEGQFLALLPELGMYQLKVEHPKAAPHEQRLEIKSDTLIRVLLEREDELEQVEVFGAKRSLTAKGAIYKLSSNALAEKDAFRALREIPELISNPQQRTLTLIDGTSPMILIDGEEQNSGLAPINPKDIESVELIEQVNARYLQMGIKAIVNIKLKPIKTLYQYYWARLSGGLPREESSLTGELELATPSYSVDAQLSGTDLYKKAMKMESYERILQQERRLSGSSLKNNSGLSSYILWRWRPSQAQLLSLFASYSSDDGSSDASYTGEQGGLGEPKQPLRRELRSREQQSALRLTSFYRYSFTKENRWSSYLYFYDRRQQRRDEAKEHLGLLPYSSQLKNKTPITYGLFDTNMEWSLKDWGNLEFGYRGSLTFQKYNLVRPGLSIDFKQQQWTHFAYLDYSGNYKSLLYTASIGLTGIETQFGSVSHSYWRPRISASLRYMIGRSQDIRLSYKMTHIEPGLDYTMPEDTSTDPKLRTVGNPYLTPTMFSQLSLVYGWQLSPRLSLRAHAMYGKLTDFIDSYSYVDHGVRVNTYRNYASQSGLVAGLNLFYRGDFYWVSTLLGYDLARFHKSQPWRQVLSMQTSISMELGKWSLNGMIFLRDRTYTMTSESRYKAPLIFNLWLNYAINEHWELGLGLPNLWNGTKMRSYSWAEGYQGDVLEQYRRPLYYPELQITWSLRKNSERRLKGFDANYSPEAAF